MRLLKKYPDAWEDSCGTIWTSREVAAPTADVFGYEDEILGWSWDDAEANFQECERSAKRRRFWESHPYLRRVCRFVVRRWRFVRLFSSTVWRDWYGRISWSTAWQIARDIHLKED